MFLSFHFQQGILQMYMMIPLIPKRRSRTPKSLPKPGSKFKRMKQRLKLKVRETDNPIDPQLEDDIEDAQPLATEAPPKQRDDAPRMSELFDNRNPCTL